MQRTDAGWRPGRPGSAVLRSLLSLHFVRAATDDSQLGVATLSVSPRIKWDHERLWQMFANQTLQAARTPLGRTFSVQTLANGGRFAFFQSPRGPNYLEWQTLADGHAGTPPHPFYMPLNRSRFAWQQCHETIADPMFVYRGFVPQNFQYGHILMDVLPVVVHVLTEKPAAKIAIQLDPDSSVKRFMEWFLPDLFDRLVFVPVETLVCAEKELLFLRPESLDISRPEHLRISELSSALHQFSLQRHRQFKVEKVIYYKRVPGAVSHSRLLEEAESQTLLELAEKTIRAHNRSDEIVSFTGASADGTLLSFKEQYRLFNSAYLAFGPHGAGMANVLWMQSSCDQLPRVIEFMCSRDAANVRGCFIATGRKRYPRPMSYWRLYGGASWIKYFIVWLLRRHDHPSDFARVDLDGFELALNQALTFADGPLQ